MHNTNTLVRSFSDNIYLLQRIDFPDVDYIIGVVDLSVAISCSDGAFS